MKSDLERAEEIDVSVEERAKTYEPTTKYDWEIRKEKLSEMDAQREHWYREAMKYSGLSAHYKKALTEITKIYPFTSAAGDLMSEIAHAALDLPYKGLGKQ